jgi:hypothetical protein
LLLGDQNIAFRWLKDVGFHIYRLRGSKRYNEIKKIRSASDRYNSTIKEDKKIIDKPRVLNISRANILAQMAAIVLLLFRAFSFVVRTTYRMDFLCLNPLHQPVRLIFFCHFLQLLLPFLISIKNFSSDISLPPAKLPLQPDLLNYLNSCKMFSIGNVIQILI